MRRYGIRVALALTLALTACGGSSSPEKDAGGTGTPSVTPSASPSPTLPPVATDKKLAKQALVTAKDLGKPWLEPKAVNRSNTKKGQLCPGHPNAAALNKARAEAKRSMTQGGQRGAAIGSFVVRVYEPGTEAAWRAAFAKATAGCRSYTSPEKLFVTLDVVATPPAIDGADDVLAYIERIYADKTKKQLYYVRHFYEVRTDRVVSTLEYAYIQPKSDPTGKDMTKSASLMEKQVAKTRTTFGL